MRHTTIILIATLVLNSFNAAAQNQIDKQGRRQGHWVRTDKDGSKIFEGDFVDGLETGVFTYYYGNGTVRMRNTSDHTVVVKASNWDADAENGLREDHKIVIMDEGHHVIASSFTIARISPGATYEAVVYFDGELVSVIYEPHWMVSAENEYIYFDL